MKPTDEIRIGDRLTIRLRGKKNIHVADFFRGGKHRRTSLEPRTKKWPSREPL